MRIYGREKKKERERDGRALMRNANDVAGSEERLSRSRSFLLLFPYACVRSRRGKYEVASRPREAKRAGRARDA